MLDARSLEDQTLDDVLGFLGQGIGENLTLDYKREISPGSDRDKAELCKDISALANSAGGMIVYGIAEEKPERTPVLPPYGIPRYVGRQPIEEWVAQTLASGVQPAMDFDVGAFDLRDAPDGDETAERCVMVVRVGPSPYAPHMVTSRADNRYYGRFYRRGNYESRIAQEYEVREMLERARRLYEGVEGEIARRGYGDPGSPDFFTSQYARRLVTRRLRGAETGDRAGARRVSVLLLPIGPVSPTGAALRDRRDWVSWLDPNTRYYAPDLGDLFVPGPTRQPTLGGIACLQDRWENDGSGMRNRGLDEYMIFGFDGAVELGFSSALREYEEDGSFGFVYFGQRILARAWQAINFTAEVRGRLGLTSPYLLLLNAKNSAGGVLAGFARGWLNQDPSASALVDYGDAPRCLEDNLQIRRELDVEDFEEVARGTWESPPPQVREISDELSSAFGLQDNVLLPR